MTVLLWGRATEPVISAIARACARLGVDAAAADGEELASVELDGDLADRDGRRVNLADVTGMLVRPEGRVTSTAAIAAYQALSAWAELTAAVVLNRPSAAASNRSKPYQLGLIAAAGFAVPDTLVTTSPDDVRAFRAEHGAIVYKSASGVRSIVTTLGPEDEARLEDITACPTQFQQFIDGLNYRVHVVGDIVLACRIDSTAVDYRYAAASGGITTMTAVILRGDIAEGCRRLARTLGLNLAGIDLKLDRHGKWWCLEANTAPGFTWFETHTGLPIADAVANLLAGRSRTRPRLTPSVSAPAPSGDHPTQHGRPRAPQRDPAHLRHRWLWSAVARSDMHRFKPALLVRIGPVSAPALSGSKSRPIAVTWAIGAAWQCGRDDQRVHVPALPDLRPALLACPSWPLIGIEERRTARAAAPGRRGAPRQARARLDWANRAVPAAADPAPAQATAGASAGSRQAPSCGGTAAWSERSGPTRTARDARRSAPRSPL